ncbi:hypothetical protein SVA_3775 [Sulfurifustis variabilis]|uniref:Uncharacterized protein n=1 Tax=Sulfurifustis variabilis TaxID=1675686 RepID=A0A1B4V9Q2_9GAMM|nr:hypothetical protein [Sulfurifustis variabilis]BAU50309.1 hypothetical protein SVA_3775 [Sulfurifustis variabilis]
MNVSSGIKVSGPPARHGGAPVAARTPESDSPAAPGLNAVIDPRPAIAERLAATALGGLSIALYAVLFWFDEELIELAQSTRRGDKRFFFVPIAVALLFSFVHGAFTGRFWDVLGLKART